MRVQLWSYNYAPEPTGIAPVSKVWADAIAARGHDVQVVAAFPHYPEPVWEHPRRPYRELIDGIPVTRLPLWVGRASAAQRVRQELSFTAAQTAAIPALGTPDVVVAVSPSFPALLPAMLNSRLRRVPWILWLHDILPDGATATGLVDDGSLLIRAARGLERRAYRSASRIVVLSEAFTRNLEAKKGVPGTKIELIYDPATRTPSAGAERNGHTAPEPRGASENGHQRLLCMGNIGFSQGLDEVVRSFEGDPDANPDVDFVITGTGVAAPDVVKEVRTSRVEMAGLVSSERLEDELQRATIGLVTQKHGGEEFNIPSKLMNLMMYGLPVVASVDPRSEVARIVNDSGGGWVVDNSDPARFATALRQVTESQEELVRRAAAARAYAQRNFSVDAFAARFDGVLRDVVSPGDGREPGVRGSA
jgi:colanic acid biosynthesis glycosyl transferase WcaI